MGRGGADARDTQTTERIVGGRAHLHDLINGAIEALVAGNFALPASSALRRLAGRMHTRVQACCVDPADHLKAILDDQFLDPVWRRLRVPNEARQDEVGTRVFPIGLAPVRLSDNRN